MGGFQAREIIQQMTKESHVTTLKLKRDPLGDVKAQANLAERLEIGGSLSRRER